MFFHGLKKGTILYRSFNNHIEVSEIDHLIKPHLFKHIYKLNPIIGDWKYCHFRWYNSSKLTKNYEYLRLPTDFIYLTTYIGTDFNKVYEYGRNR